MSLLPDDLAKRAAAARAVELVEEGMTLGLGTGSTAEWFVRLLAERVRETGLKVTGVATSTATETLARDRGLTVVALEEAGPIDLTVDGADEADLRLNLVKGGGGALLREKIVAAASARMVVIAQAAKQVKRLGAFPLPVEVVRFGWPLTRAAVEDVLGRANVGGREIVLRETGSGPLVTEEGHHILDLHLKWIEDPSALALALNALPGVVDHGLFLGMAERVIFGRADGTTEDVGPPRRAERQDVDAVVESMRNQDA